MHSESIVYLEPWYSITDEASRRELELELNQEVGYGHVLFGREAKALARRCDCDDVLFEVTNPVEFAVVHLAYSARPDQPPWPKTSIFEDLEVFISARMKPDHENYV